MSMHIITFDLEGTNFGQIKVDENITPEVVKLFEKYKDKYDKFDLDRFCTLLRKNNIRFTVVSRGEFKRKPKGGKYERFNTESY